MFLKTMILSEIAAPLVTLTILSIPALCAFVGAFCSANPSFSNLKNRIIFFFQPIYHLLMI
jgi:hypothetical protein